MQNVIVVLICRDWHRGSDGRVAIVARNFGPARETDDPRHAVASHLSRMAGWGAGVGNAKFHRKIIGFGLPHLSFGRPACHCGVLAPGATDDYFTEAARLLVILSDYLVPS
jgi:hypothetical protein